MPSAEPKSQLPARLAVLAAMGVGLVLFIVAVFQDVAVLEEGAIGGVMALAMGWLAILEGQFGWFANVLLVAVWLLSLVANKKLAFVAMLLSMLTLAVGYSSFITLRMMDPFHLAEMDMHGEVQSFGVGIFVWSAALLSAPAAALLSFVLSPSKGE